MHAVVIGAGIIGLCTARALLDAGHEVTLLDEAEQPASGASGQNGAQLSYAYVAPLATPAVLRELPALLTDAHSPLRVQLSLSPRFMAWGLQFLWACRHRQVERTTHALLQLAELSRQQLHEWMAGSGPQGLDHRRNGKLVVYRSPAAFGAAQRQMALQARWGCRQQAWDAQTCVAREPALEGVPLAGGIYTPDEEVADCRKVCLALFKEVSRHPRCRTLLGARITGWETDGGRVRSVQVRLLHGEEQLRADAVVVACGIGSNELLAPLGVRLPIEALKGYSLEIDRAALRRYPQCSITDSARKVVFAPLGSGADARLRVAGIAELGRRDVSLDSARLGQLVQAASAVFGFQAAVDVGDLSPWAGLRPMTPTGLPYIGRVRRWQNVYANTGHGALGFTLAFGSAALLADLLARREPLRQLQPFARSPLAAV